MSEITLPRDEFSVRLRELSDHPGAVKSSSRIDVVDFYGRLETWTIDTFRVDGQQTAFVQRMSAEAPLRILMPPQVTAALGRQDAALTSASRRKGARQAMATRIARGDVIGNPEALRRARKARKGGKK